MMTVTGTNSVYRRSGVILMASLIFSLLFAWSATLVSAAPMQPSDCAQCHGSNVAAGHHQSDAYDQGLCSQCHEGVVTGGDCASCHTFVPQQNAHHTTAEAVGGNCAECHTNAGDLADCLECHKGKIRTPHHLAADNDPRTPAVDPIACASCHTTMEPLAGCSATSCHPADLKVAHHNSPDANSGNCAACHTGMPSVVGCESCHSSAYWTANSSAPDARGAHHAVAGASQNCQDCHTNAPRPFNCHDCHQGESAGRHHVMLQTPPGLTCANCHDAIALDTRRTTPGLDKAYTGCQDCHEPSLANQTLHHDKAMANPDLTCGTCHSDAGNVPDCAGCHTAGSWGVDASNNPLNARDVHHGFSNAQTTDCSVCHTAMTFDNRCESCHVSGEVRMRTHHDPAEAPVSCGFCHGASADVPANNSCQFCHDAAFWQADGRVGTALEQHHDVVLGRPGAENCADCHATLVPQSCATCHDSAFWTTAGRAGSAEGQHHDVVRVAGAGLACGECHTGGLPGENNNCQECHSGEAQAFHHEMAASGTSCQECHVDLPAVVDCESCHTSGSWVANAQMDHHASPTAANNDCSVCHAVVVPDDCTQCHTAETWTTDPRTDHHNTAMGQGLGCSSCHETIASTSGCRSCHGNDWPPPDPITGARTENLHHTKTSYGFGCLDCHYYASGWTLAMPTEDACKTCHTVTLASTTVPALHHVTAAAQNEQCGSCHLGIADIDPLSLDCATCHARQPAAKDGSLTMHHGQPEYASGNCASCHQGLIAAQLDCATCHAGQSAPVDRTGSLAMHHATEIYAANDCAACHQGTVALDCAGCHIDPTDPALVPIPERHHSSDFAQAAGRACADCHTGAEVVSGNCELCHVGNGQPAVADRHHATASYVPGNCVTCHAGIDGVTGEALDCAVCHAGTALKGDIAMHHGTPDGAPNYAADNCSTCHNVRNFAQLVAANACVTCHTGGNPEIISGRHHETLPATTENCAACHSVDQSELDCATCHANQPLKDGKAPMHHATATATAPGAACSDCHATVDVANVSCATCHASQPLLNGGLAMHHATPAYGAGLCMTCHLGAESALMDCAGCHVDPSNPAPISDRHHKSDYARTVACTACHSAVNTAELDCQLCHAQQPATVNGSLTMHHDLTLSGSTKQCATCHAGATIVENDCSTCHTGGGTQALADTHHGTPTAQTGLCSACHVGAEAEGIGCASCHGSDSNHHTQPTYVSGDCVSCHTTITLNGANCEACHTSPGKPSIEETHHGTPLTDVGGNCAACHQAVSSPNVCGNCHSDSPHHTTSWSIAGDCAHCHTVPAAVQDRPAQAACRECHGSTKHNKGGPVQNFAACAACHNTVPFHPKPSSAPGYTKMVGGKGKFNLFWSAMTNGGDDQIREDVRPNGEDMNDEGGYRYRYPTISFNMYPIEYAGKAYQVPGFSPPANYGSATAGLSSCTSCHVDRGDKVACSNSKWTAHLSLGRVPQATYQLAEAVFIGNLCGGTSPSTTNLAKSKSASASDDEGSSYSASKAVDGSTSSRWYVRSYRQEWLKVDLGQTQRISKVVIKWHSEYAREYEVQVSTNNSTWTRVVSDSNGNGGTDTVTFSARDARYVRVLCDRRQNNGYSIYELEVYQ